MSEPQKPPVLAQPETVFPEMVASASSTPLIEPVTLSRSVPTLSAGKVNLATPARWVAVSSVLIPVSVVMAYEPGEACSLACWKVWT